MSLKHGLAAIALASTIGANAQGVNQMQNSHDPLQKGDPKITALQNGVQAQANSIATPPSFGEKVNVNGTILSGKTEFSKELGALVRGGVATRIGENGAVYVEISVGPKQREFFTQAGIEIGNNTMVTITYQNLEQYRNFAFPSGKSDEWVNQQAFGISGRIYVDAGFLKYLELQGYHIEAPSKDLSDKEFTVSTPALFQIFNDYRRLAGNKTDGVKLVVRLGTDDGKYTLDLEAGTETIKRLTLIDTPTKHRTVGGARLGYHPTPDSEIYGGISQPAGDKTIGSVGYKNGMWNIGANSANKGTLIAGIQIPFDAFFQPISKNKTTKSSYNSDARDTPITVSYNDWVTENPNWTPELQRKGDEIRYNDEFFSDKMRDKLGRMGILDRVQTRDSWVPRNVLTTVDETASPKLVLAVDNPDGPGKSTDKITGDITLTEALGFGTLISALNTTNGQTLPVSSYTLGTTTLVIHPRALESILSAGNNTLVIDTTLATTTLIVEKGSVKVHSTSVVRKILNTAPVANADSATTLRNTAVTVNPLTNDTDTENNTLSIGSFTQGAHGAVTRTGNSLIYTPVAGYIGTDTFTYYAYDGTTNSLTPATVTVTVNAPVNNPGTIAAPTLESKSDTTINTAPGTTAGMTNIRVEAYSDVGLTTLVGTQASGDFSGLLASTTYYFVTVADDVNENTLVTETKRSPTALSITTDAPPPPANAAPTSITLTPATLTASGLSVGQSAGSLTCADDYSPTCSYTLMSQSYSGAFAVSGAGAITVVDTSLAAGNYTITVVATDAGGLGKNETKTITVGAALPPANAAPTAITLTPATLTTGSLSVGQSAGSLACTDDYSATCSYSLSSQSTPGAFAVSGTGAITVVDTSLAAGNHTITVVATDGGGLPSSAITKTITVDAAPVLPSCTTAIDDLGATWTTGAVMNINISSCTSGATWTVTDITSGGPVLDWWSPLSGSGDGIITFQILGGTEGKIPSMKVTVTKGSDSQQYILTAPSPID